MYFDIKFAFNKWSLGEDFCLSLGFSKDEIEDSSFDMLAALGFTNKEIEEANDFICGTMTVEGAPHLKDEHLPVFDTANKCGKKGPKIYCLYGSRSYNGGSTTFISGAISKTVNMPANATVNEVGEVYMESWKIMVSYCSLS
jgi:ribonucleoside-diphosphate reductase alpha chain